MSYNTGQTNREVIYSFKHLVADKGPISDESSWSNREIYFMLLRYRSRLLSQKVRDRKFSLSRHNLQTIGCVPLDKVDQEECPCIPASGYTFLKSKYKLPRPIGNLQSVTSTTGNIHYDYLQWERFEDLQESRFPAERKKPYYTLRNVGDGTYLYIYNEETKLIKFVSATGIFENPLEVQNYPNCETGSLDPCFSPLDEEFILDPDLLPLVYDFALQQLARAKQPGIDILNDDQDNVSSTQVPLK